MYNILILQLLRQESFEKDTDTTGWNVYCFSRFVDEGVPGCGKRSIGISCDCFGPNTNFKIGPFDNERNVVFSVWAKSADNGGGKILELPLDIT